MPITKQWPGGATNATPTSFSLPLNNELNWLQLTSFLQSLADSAQGTTFQKFKVRVVTASPDTISATADCILAVNVSGAATVNLPAGAEKQVFFIVDSSGAAATNNITITPNGSETVRGSASLVLNKNYQGVVLAFTGTDWKAFGPFTTPGSITDADFTGQLSTAKGGTGQNSTATFPTTGTVATVPSAGVVKSSGTALTSSNVNLTSEVTGTLPVANGGTGITSFGTGVATALGQNVTGSGSIVLSGSPTFTGTPISPSVQISGTAGAGFVELAEQASSPSTPASGFARIYPKTDNKLYLKDDAGVETQLGAGGVGEINVVENPSDANNWGTSNATVTTTTTAANLPLGPLIDTAIEIASSTSGGYARYRWTMPVSLRQRKLKVAWQQVAATLTSGDYKVEVYKNSASDYSGSYTEFSLSTDSSGTSSIPNLNGQYQTTFDADDGIYYELRVVRTAASSATIRLAGVTVGPGIQPQGAVVGEWQTFTPVWSGAGTATFSANQGSYRRVGSSIEIKFETTISALGTASGSVGLTLPSGLTINTTVTSQDGPQLGTSFTSDGRYLNAQNWGSPHDKVLFIKSTNAALTWADWSTNRHSGELFIPISQWSGSGTVQLAQNDVEYAWNSSTSTTSDTTSFGYGPQGVLICDFAPTTTNSVDKRVRFQTPIQPGDSLVLEVDEGSSGARWVPLVNRLGAFGYDAATPTFAFGTFVNQVTGSATDVDVRFFSKITIQSTNTWSQVNTWRWRLRKSSAGAAVGFGIVSPGVSSGLVSASGLPGNTTGNAIAAGYVGEKITWTSAPSTQTATTSYADWTNASITLTAGIWLVQANINCVVTSGTTAGNDGELQIRITDSSNSVLQNLEKILRVKTPASAASTTAGCLTFSGIFNYATSSNVLKIRIKMNNVNGTNTGAVYNDTTTYSEFFAIRIA